MVTPKQKQTAFALGSLYLQVVGSGAPGAPRALYVFAEHSRYLFNCGEGTQRLANEHKVKLSALRHVFVTQNAWENVGGMPGMLLTLQDVGTPVINVYGPPGIDFIYHDTKNFMRFNNLEIEPHTFSQETEFTEHGDGPLKIKTVPICSVDSKTRVISESDCKILIEENKSLDLYGHEGRNGHKQKETKDTLRTSREEMFLNKDLALSYICQLPSQPGKLLPQLCKSHGVPAGPLWGQLKLGSDVTLENGTVVKSSDVTTPSKKGSIFIVLEVPTEDHLPSLLSSKSLASHQTGDDSAEVVVHFTPTSVLKHPDYIKWMNQFPSTTKHILINDNSTCMGSERVHKIQYKLNHLYPNSFPLLREPGSSNYNKRLKAENGSPTYCCSSNFKFSQNRDLSDLENAVDVDGQALQAFSMLAYHFRPSLGMQLKMDLQVTPEVYLEECHSQSGFPEAKESIDKISGAMPNEREEFPNIIFLGTGSCIPNKTRNTSGILVNLSPSSSIIMDCGEGTYGQLVRMFGLTEATAILTRVKAIYVSHLHADHHIGLIRLLVAKKNAGNDDQDRPMLLLAPEGIRQYLYSLDIFQPIVDHFKFVDNVLLTQHIQETDEIIDLVCNQIGLERISTCFVPHCPFAYGISLVTKDGWKLTYSGDTMPSDNLISIGQDSDVLIHEATMEDSLHEDAKHKRHSTVSQAIEVGEKMKAKNVILTHFSQRYARLPYMKVPPSNVSIAFDNMVIRMSDLEVLPHLYPALLKMFSEEYDEMMNKSEKKLKARSNLESTSTEM